METFGQIGCAIPRVHMIQYAERTLTTLRWVLEYFNGGKYNQMVGIEVINN